MNARERGFLLLTSCFGNAERCPLTVAQLRTLAMRVQAMDRPENDRDLTQADLIACGYGQDMSMRILSLLSQEDELAYYLQKAKRYGCAPITRVSTDYPPVLHRCLQLDCPGVLWAKGDVSLLKQPMVGLVGSRDISPENRKFAAEAGRQAALQGYTLVSGNARGADRVAQESCLKAGGNVIVVTADGIVDKREEKHILYLCEDSFDLPFSAQRALSRNRIIHCLGRMVLVAQCAWKSGGTWSGTVKNLACGWSPVFCFDDGSKAVGNLEQMGAERIGMEALGCLAALPEQQRNIFHESFLK